MRTIARTAVVVRRVHQGWEVDIERFLDDVRPVASAAVVRMGRLIGTHPLAAALAVEGALLLLALLLARLFGLEPWAEMHLSTGVVAITVAGVAPLAVTAWLLFASGIGWVRELERITQQIVEAIFRGAPRGGVVAVALLAGFGEELLFRGVVQAGLAPVLGPLPALLLASLLFGLAHAVSMAYLVATALIGVYLGLLYTITGNLLIACLVHALYDWLAIHYYLRRRPTSR